MTGSARHAVDPAIGDQQRHDQRSGRPPSRQIPARALALSAAAHTGRRRHQVRAQRAEVCATCAHPANGLSAPTGESPANPKWTMLGSNQRPPPCRGGKAGSGRDRIGYRKPRYAGDSKVWHDLRLRRDTADSEPGGRTEDAGRKVSSRLRGSARGRPRPVFASGTTRTRRRCSCRHRKRVGRRVTLDRAQRGRWREPASAGGHCPRG